MIDVQNCPILSMMAEDDKMLWSKLHITKSLLAAVMALIGEDNAEDFQFENSKKGRVILILQSLSLSGLVNPFCEYVTGPMSCDKNDAAELLTIYLRKKYECAFIIAAAELGMPLVTQMDEVTAAAMWADANVTLTQQKIVKKHLWHVFGSCVIVPETKQHILGDMDSGVQPVFGKYSYYRNNVETDGEEQPAPWEAENCLCCHCDVAFSFMHDMEWVLQCNIPVATYNTKNGIGLDLLRGADHRKRAWQSWMKISHKVLSACGSVGIWLGVQNSKASKSSASKMAHLVCKKDHPDILKVTVTKPLLSGYNKLMASYFIWA